MQCAEIWDMRKTGNIRNYGICVNMEYAQMCIVRQYNKSGTGGEHAHIWKARKRGICPKMEHA